MTPTTAISLTKSAYAMVEATAQRLDMTTARQRLTIAYKYEKDGRQVIWAKSMLAEAFARGVIDQHNATSGGTAVGVGNPWCRAPADLYSYSRGLVIVYLMGAEAYRRKDYSDITLEWALAAYADMDAAQVALRAAQR